MMNTKKYNEFLDAVDVVCDRCSYGNEETCEGCPVRKTCDELAENQRKVREKCSDCIPESMKECENCAHHRR